MNNQEFAKMASSCVALTNVTANVETLRSALALHEWLEGIASGRLVITEAPVAPVVPTA